MGRLDRTFWAQPEGERQVFTEPVDLKNDTASDFEQRSGDGSAVLLTKDGYFSTAVPFKEPSEQHFALRTCLFLAEGLHIRPYTSQEP